MGRLPSAEEVAVRDEMMLHWTNIKSRALYRTSEMTRTPCGIDFRLPSERLESLVSLPTEVAITSHAGIR